MNTTAAKKISAIDPNGMTWVFVPTADPAVFVSYFKCVWSPELGDFFDDGRVTIKGKPTANKLLATKGF